MHLIDAGFACPYALGGMRGHGTEAIFKSQRAEIGGRSFGTDPRAHLIADAQAFENGDTPAIPAERAIDTTARIEDWGGSQVHSGAFVPRG